MGIPVWQPYLSEHKRQRTYLGEFECESFELPHNGCPNVGYFIRVDGQTIVYMTDMEYCGWNLSKQDINILIVECNYISELVPDDLPNIQHKIIGHSCLDTTIGIIKNCQKHLRKVFLIHASKGVTMNKERALKEIREQIPDYIEVEFCKDNTTYNISEIPF